MQVCFYLLVPLFGLSICLRVVGCGHCTFYTKALEDRAEEFAGELGSSIRDDLPWESVQSEVFSNEVVCGSVSVNLFGAGNEVYHLPMSIDNELNHIVSSIIRQAGDEITGDYLSWAIGDLVGLQWTMQLGV